MHFLGWPERRRSAQRLPLFPLGCLPLGAPWRLRAPSTLRKPMPPRRWAMPFPVEEFSQQERLHTTPWAMDSAPATLPAPAALRHHRRQSGRGWAELGRLIQKCRLVLLLIASATGLARRAAPCLPEICQKAHLGLTQDQSRLKTSGVSPGPTRRLQAACSRPGVRLSHFCHLPNSANSLVAGACRSPIAGQPR